MRYLVLFSIIFSKLTFAQIGGNTSFNNLNRIYNARSLALGGYFISQKDKDPNLSINNPALLNSELNKKFAFNQLFQTGDIQNGMLVYTRNVPKVNCVQNFSLRYVDYGKNIETNEFGEEIGNFTPIDFIFSSGIGKKINNHLSFGTQLNLLYSQYSSLNSIGVSVDFGAHYILKDTTQSFSLLLKNAGYQLKGFTKDRTAELPTEIQLAYTHKLKHAPFRFNYLFHHLNKWDLTYFDPNTKVKIDPLTGDSILPKKANLIQKTALHITPQIELLIGKNIHIRFAFDYFKRYQMALTNRPGISGFSFGVGLYFKRFSIDYGFSGYSTAGNLNGISFISSLDQWRKKSVIQ
jgi:hypothetical protein